MLDFGCARTRATAPGLVALPSPDRIDALSGVYEFCAAKGYLPEGEAIRVGAWPVQSVPVFNTLTREAMEQEVEKLLQRQALWQKSRTALSWSEKIRMAERIRASLERWHSMAGKDTVVPRDSKNRRA